ncbi:MAG TPA: hypothetical protein VHU82_06355 [Vicinamibacterales bacterium]|nr:hypothetical protein [Vicinamibacterales bacterium]
MPVLTPHCTNPLRRMPSSVGVVLACAPESDEARAGATRGKC